MARPDEASDRPVSVFAREMQALVSALQFATRLPLPDPGWESGRMARAAPWLPVAGLAAGLVGALVLIVAATVLPMAVAAGLALAAMLAATGALHEDGFADLADAAGGWADRTRALEILRDSRHGTYAVAALVLLIGLRWTALAGMTLPAAAMALVLAAVLGRAAMLAVLMRPAPARPDGLAATLIAADGDMAVAARLPSRLAVSVVLVAVVAAVAGGVAGALAFVAAVLSAGVVALIAARRLGGHTGDSFGAAAAAGETAALIVFAALPPPGPFA